MTAPTTRPAFDPDAAEENSRRKAKPIAAYAHRVGITWEELGRLPYTDPDRKAPSLRRFAAAAFRAADVAENPPHSRTSDTWRYVRDELADLADRARFGFDDVPDRDLADQRAEWVREVAPDEPADAMPAAIPAGQPVTRRVRPTDLVPYADPPALVTSGSPPLRPGDAVPDAPRGWAAVAALGPLPWPTAACRWCGDRAVTGTLNGYRCAAHPPRRGDPKGDWGWGLDWTPKPGRVCLASVCYCGRCRHYDTTGARPAQRPGAESS